MKKLLKNGQRLTENGQLETVDVLINGETIEAIGANLQVEAAETIDVNGKLISAGFIDVHVHLREPGGEHKETIATGTLAAAKGGYTTVCAMPNTKPVPDTKEQVEWLMKRIDETAVIRVKPYGSITTRLLGQDITDLAGLAESGAFAFTDDGVGVQTANVMYEAMQQAASLNKPIVAHCEDNSLIYKGSVHEGQFAKEHGLNGIPSICESVQIARDVLLAEAANCHYHVCHISTKESVRVVRDAKRAGVRVTTEVSPHHLLLADADIPGLDTNYKMNPPLRGVEDRAALIEGLLDGTIDMIATDHAPHTEEEKGAGMQLSPFGIVGLETAFPLLYTNFVQKGIFSLKQLIDWMTVKPQHVFGFETGTLQVGALADLTVIDLAKTAKIDKATFLSKGRNTPFDGWECQGWPVMTFVGGNLVWKDGGEQ